MAAQGKIAIIGKGNVGSALKAGLTRAGYGVQAIGKEAAKVPEVARWGDVVILAVPFAERQNVVREMGNAIVEKPLVDVTNALKDGKFASTVDKSGAEELQEMARGAKVVKAFNTVFAKNMSTGRVLGEPISAFVAADDRGAKDRVLRMARDIGFDAVDAGPLKHAHWLEAIGFFHIQLGFTLGMGPDTEFKLVHKGSVRTTTNP